MSQPINVREYYLKYGPMVLRRCRRLLGNEDLALDAMQDTFVMLIKKRARLNDRAPSSLLFRIATNQCLNRLRSLQRHPEDPDQGLIDSIAAYEEPESRSVARLFLARLWGDEPESTKTIAVMYLVDGFTHAEIAHEIGLSVSGVRKRIRKLQASLNAMEGANP